MPTDGSDPPGGSPVDAFASLAHETRLDVIRTLGAPETAGRMPRLSFSELRDRVGVPNSSRFNYHLGELVGRYVEAGEEGYALTYPGLLVWTAMRKGVYADPGSVSVDPFALAAACPSCDGSLCARYEGGGVEVACRECGAFFFRRPLPPTTAEAASREHLLEVAGRKLLQEVAFRRAGLCPICKRRVDPVVRAADEVGVLRDTRDLELLVVHDCEHCTVYSFNTVGEYVLSHPAVRTFLLDRGVDPARPWAVEFAACDDHTAVQSTDPWAVAVEVRAGGEARVADVDGSLSVDFHRG
jgi:uncharacterized CHY-type Zn-finger protein